MKILAIIFCELLLARSLIRFFAGWVSYKGTKVDIINMIVDYSELMMLILTPILLMVYC